MFIVKTLLHEINFINFKKILSHNKSRYETGASCDVLREGHFDKINIALASMDESTRWSSHGDKIRRAMRTKRTQVGQSA